MEKNELIIQSEQMVQEMTSYDNLLIKVMNYLGLPSNKIIVPVSERKKVFNNLNYIANELNNEQLLDAMYLSKFLAAVGAGLFDAALNYLWDETISQLRKRVSQYDIQYFYDLAIPNNDRRKKFNTSDDLILVDDSELIKGCKEIGLISSVGYKHLDYIKYMRNWASAAHPNQIEIAGLQLIGWLETCIKEVMCLPLNNVTIEINKLLKNIKDHIITNEEAKKIISFFCELTEDRADSLMNGFIGLFTRPDTTLLVRQNILLLASDLWKIVSEEVKCSIGVKYAQSVASGDKNLSILIRDFLDKCNGQSYLPDGIKAVEIKEVLNNLRQIHDSTNNFYNEPMFARELKRIVGEKGLPKECDFDFANTVTYVFLTNGYGIAWSAEPIYIEIIKNFTQRQAMISMLCFRYSETASKLQFSLCKEKYKELLNLIDPIIVTPLFRELFLEIKSCNNIENLNSNSKINNKIPIVQKSLK